LAEEGASDGEKVSYTRGRGLNINKQKRHLRQRKP